MAHFLEFLTLALLLHQCVWATRYLPTIVWDHLNPLLSCKCNWLVIPYVDRYDQQQFTCPTDRIFSNLLNGYRPNTQRNENIFRRKWPGTKSDLINTIRNGSIDAFCDPKNPGTTRLHQCKNGEYDHKEVTYKYVNKNPGESYEEDNIYIFFNNGDDGTVSTLSSNEAKCTMFFAVHVTYQKMAVYGMNFDKAALTGTENCELSSCPPNSSTVTVSNPRVSSSLTTIATIPGTTSSARTSATKSLVNGAQQTPTSTRTITSRSVVKTATEKPKTASPVCLEKWSSVEIVAVIVAFIIGVAVALLIFYVLRRRERRKNDRNYEENGKTCSSANGSPRPTDQIFQERQKQQWTISANTWNNSCV